MSNNSKRYDQEFKADIVKLLREEKSSVASIVELQTKYSSLNLQLIAYKIPRQSLECTLLSRQFKSLCYWVLSLYN